MGVSIGCAATGAMEAGTKGKIVASAGYVENRTSVKSITIRKSIYKLKNLEYEEKYAYLYEI
ncbi:hypothetical protein [Janthinobacterium agaricidamnosum]|uniref:hypothetical protein n=1 Tax=Janthinobacterium agaricidamnosum TaxID=55508 RepID=UPI00056DEEF2|nr:hypothetical protein [Janthinobacterium agaricidamnosum]